VAHYLQIPQATLRSWVIGRHYEAGGEKRLFKPLILPVDAKRHLLSNSDSNGIRPVAYVPPIGLLVNRYEFGTPI
jgi:hypothetical protein